MTEANADAERHLGPRAAPDERHRRGQHEEQRQRVEVAGLGLALRGAERADHLEDRQRQRRQQGAPAIAGGGVGEPVRRAQQGEVGCHGNPHGTTGAAHRHRRGVASAATAGAVAAEVLDDGP